MTPYALIAAALQNVPLQCQDTHVEASLTLGMTMALEGPTPTKQALKVAHEIRHLELLLKEQERAREHNSRI